MHIMSNEQNTSTLKGIPVYLQLIIIDFHIIYRGKLFNYHSLMKCIFASLLHASVYVLALQAG